MEKVVDNEELMEIIRGDPVIKSYVETFLLAFHSCPLKIYISTYFKSLQSLYSIIVQIYLIDLFFLFWFSN